LRVRSEWSLRPQLETSKNRPFLPREVGFGEMPASTCG
jgi:hypothetical protein